MPDIVTTLVPASMSSREPSGMVTSPRSRYGPSAAVQRVIPLRVPETPRSARSRRSTVMFFDSTREPRAPSPSKASMRTALVPREMGMVADQAEESRSKSASTPSTSRERVWYAEAVPERATVGPEA